MLQASPEFSGVGSVFREKQGDGDRSILLTLETVQNDLEKGASGGLNAADLISKNKKRKLSLLLSKKLRKNSVLSACYVGEPEEKHVSKVVCIGISQKIHQMDNRHMKNQSKTQHQLGGHKLERYLITISA